MVLIHGANGMGKTSVLSALELGLAGGIGHLSASGDGYRKFLTNWDSADGRIDLTVSGPHKHGAGTNGSVSFSDTAFDAEPLLDAADARFFSERCYLPQATLGKLLEIYDDKKTSTISPLTLFVKELLGLDPLDALVDGLYAAFNVTRIRNLVPEYRRLESLQKSLREEYAQTERSIRQRDEAATRRRGALLSVLATLVPNAPVQATASMQVEDLRNLVGSDNNATERLTDLSRARSDLALVIERWRTLPQGGVTHDAAEQERVDAEAAKALAAWRTGEGSALDAVLTELRKAFPDLPSMDDGPDVARAAAEKRAETEANRCTDLLTQGDAAADRLKGLQAIIQRSSARIDEISTALASSVADTRSLANALAALASHIDTERCPVCDRDFSDTEQGSLSSHVAAKIASLTTEAGRLQALANERAEESERLTNARRDQLSAEREQLPPDERAALTVRLASMVGIVQRLRSMLAVAQRGAALTASAVAAKAAVTLAHRRDAVSSSILPQIDQLVASVTGRPRTSYQTVDEALAEADRPLKEQTASAEAQVSMRVKFLTELEYYAKDLAEVARMTEDNKRISGRISAVGAAVDQVDGYREHAKKVSDAAEKVRSEVVKTVFNTSLNKIWRDLFIRLAPSEQFVPAFKLPPGDRGMVEAVLETLHRSGRASGSPAAMLSQGNLNTAALTLFLALHLSVPTRMPWLVLDDPVQSMDDVHIAQFAALLRTLSKGLDRQLVVAVHDRALFDYLILELSPAFPGDSLISVEITRNFEGDAVATPQALVYQEDRAIAAA